MKNKLRRRGMIIAASVFVLLIPNVCEVNAQQSISSSLGVIVFPAKGQPAQQQNSDEGECYSWARQETGIDPMALANTPTQQGGAAAGGGQRFAGAARGALGGLAIGAIAGDAGKGAAIGAVAGTMLGGREARMNQEAQQQQAQQAKSAAHQQFNKAFGVCLEAKGYTVR